jgi:hypothetical protein
MLRGLVHAGVRAAIALACLAMLMYAVGSTALVHAAAIRPQMPLPAPGLHLPMPEAPMRGALQAGTVLHVASCAQPPAPGAQDRVTYSAAQLARFGFPARPSDPTARAVWARMVRAARTRQCAQTVTSQRNQFDEQLDNWGGYIADQSGTPQQYTQIYGMYNVPCLAGSTESYVSNWVGLGGVVTSNLVQSGTTEHRYQDWLGRWVDDDVAWVENVGDASNPNANDVFGVRCRDEIAVGAWGQNCMAVEDLTTGSYSGARCYGPPADPNTAEGILERPAANTDPNSSLAKLADFGSWTLQMVSVCSVASPCDSLDTFGYDASTMWSCYPALFCEGNALVSLGPIVSGSYKMTWLNYH